MQETLTKLKNIFTSDPSIKLKSYPTSKVRAKDGKKEYSYSYVYSPVTDTDWVKHLEGSIGLGLMAILQDNTCRWAAIDIDVYDLDVYKLTKEFHDKAPNFIVCKSKSNGAHVYIFFDEPIPAINARKYLKHIATEFGYSGAEIYPKQDSIPDGGNRGGSGLNMPYFNSDQRTAIAYNEDEDDYDLLSIHEFAELALARSVSLDEFNLLVTEKSKAVDSKSDFDEMLKGAPPCLQYLCKRGIEAGKRNNTFVNIANYCKKRYGKNDEWKSKVFEFKKFLLDDMDDAEIATIINSVAGKEYQYTCKQEPLCSHCNSAVCVTKEYGIDGNNVYPEIVTFIKVDSSPPIWLIEFDKGIKIECDTDTLQSQRLFQKAFLDKTNILLPKIKDKDYEFWIRKGLEKLTVIAPDADTLIEEEIFVQLKTYIVEKHSGDIQAIKEPDGVYLSKKGIAYFKLNDFRNYLIKRMVISKDISKQKIAMILTDLGVVQERLCLDKSDRPRVRGLNTASFIDDFFNKEDPKEVIIREEYIEVEE